MTENTELPSGNTATNTSRENLFSKGNIAIALGAVALLLAGAPYVVPALQSQQVRGGLMSQPKILEEVIKKLDEQKADERKQAADIAIKANHNALYADKRDPVLGNPNAPITVVEFLDYNCGYCKRAAPEVEKLLAENKDVRVVVKEYPVIAQSSRALASYALATRDTGRYSEVHHAMMGADLKTEGDVLTLLSGLGLNAQAIAAKAKSQEVQSQIDSVLQLGTQLSIDGTPAFIVGGVLVNGADMNGLKVAIEAQRTKAN